MRALQEKYTQTLRNSDTPETLSSTLQNAFPLLYNKYKKLDLIQWQKLVRNFFNTHPLKTPILHEIPDEFVEFLHLQGDKNNFELAHYDWVEIILELDSIDLNTINYTITANIIDHIPLISPLAYLVHYETFTKNNENHHIIWRNRNHQVSYLAVNIFSAKFFELLKNNKTLSGQAVLELLILETNPPNPILVIKNGLALLQHWREKEIILGASC